MFLPLQSYNMIHSSNFMCDPKLIDCWLVHLYVAFHNMGVVFIWHLSMDSALLLISFLKVMFAYLC